MSHDEYGDKLSAVVKATVDTDIFDLYRGRWADPRFWPIPEMIQLQLVRELRQLAETLRHVHLGE